MNPNTGHLVVGTLDDLRRLKEQGYEPIPDELAQAARRKLAGKKEAYVSLTSGGKLAKWAALTRKQRRKLGIKSYKDFSR